MDDQESQEEWYAKLQKEGIVKIKPEEKAIREFDKKALAKEFKRLLLVWDLLHDLSRFEMLGFYEDTQSKKAMDYRTRNSDLTEDLLAFYKEKNGLRANEITNAIRILDVLSVHQRVPFSKIKISDFANTLRLTYQGDVGVRKQHRPYTQGPDHYNTVDIAKKVAIATECQRQVGVFLDQFSVKVPIEETKEGQPSLELQKVM